MTKGINHSTPPRVPYPRGLNINLVNYKGYLEGKL